MEWFKRQSFTRLILVAIALIIVPFAVVIYITYGQIMQLGQAESKLESGITLYEVVSDFNEASGGTKSALYRLTGFRNPADVETYKTEMGKADKLVEDVDKLAKTKTSDAKTSELLNAMVTRWREFDAVAEAVANKYSDKKYVDGSLAKIESSEENFAIAIGNLHDDVAKDLKNNIQALRDARNGVIDTITKGVIAAFIIIAIALFVLFRSVLKPLKKSFADFGEASLKMSRASQGLSGNAGIINQTTAQITSAIGQVASGANDQSKDAGNTLGLVEQISGAISQVAQSAQTQVSSVDEMAKGIDQLIESINSVSESANVVATAVEEASAVAGKGKGAVDETIGGMQSIKSTVLDSAYKIETLGEKSKQIGEIIEVIDDIAEQTNLLALNAAIEAARAGEHGKGFAVVADEVRKLAERSARATGEIADLIKGIQGETMDAVETMEKGTKEVENGSKLAENAGSAIEEMMNSIRQVVEQIAQVSEYADNMTTASTKVSKAVEQIAAISEENSATAEQVSSSTSQVVNAVDSIAASSQESAASAEEVSASTEEQAASIEEMSAQIESLASMSEELDKIVKRVRI
jgi:methyl-accepting chemotaxis protein